MYRVYKGKYGLIALGMLLAAGMFFWQSDAVRAGLRQGMQLCYETVIPSLFFFLVLCEWLTRSGASFHLNRSLGWLFRPFMGQGAAASVGLLLSLLGGYPAGAIALKGMEQQGEITKEQVSLLSLVLFVPSPAFAVVAMGGLFGSQKAGWLLWMGCVVPFLLFAGIGSRVAAKRHPFAQNKSFPSIHLAESFSPAVMAAARSLLLICAMVLVFSGLAACLDRLPVPDWCKQLLLAAGEVTSAGRALWQKGLPFLAAVLSFGGICTHMQVQGILREQMPPYWLYGSVRLLQAGLAYGVTYGLCRLFPTALPVFAKGGIPASVEGGWLSSTALLVTCVVFLGSFGLRDPSGQGNRKTTLS